MQLVLRGFQKCCATECGRRFFHWCRASQAFVFCCSHFMLACRARSRPRAEDASAVRQLGFWAVYISPQSARLRTWPAGPLCRFSPELVLGAKGELLERRTPRAKRTRAVLGAHASLFIGSPAGGESESPDLPPWLLPPRVIACYCRLQLLPVGGGRRLNAC